MIITEDYTGDSGTEKIYTYDSCTNGNGRLCTAVNLNNATTTYTYDANSNLIQEDDALGNITTHTYGSYNEKLSTTDPNGNTTIYTYDQYMNLISVNNELNQTTTYTNDIIGNKLSMTDPNRNNTSYILQVLTLKSYDISMVSI